MEISEFLKSAVVQNKIVLVRGAKSLHLQPILTSRPVIEANTDRLTDVTRFEPSDFYITCQAGMSLLELQKILREHKLMFPFLGNGCLGTVGGMVSTSIIKRKEKCYNISRWVLALKLAMPDGEIVKTGAFTYKSVAGYDLTRLFCGSYGSLGIILEASLRLYAEGSKPFGRNMNPVKPRIPIFVDSRHPAESTNRAQEISSRIKNSFDPNGIFPRISGWNA